MSISQIFEIYHINRIKSIKNMNKGIEKDLTIGALVADLGKRLISAISRAINVCREKVKSCCDKFKNGIQLTFEFRGRKSILCTYPNLINDIEDIIEKFKHQDSHFKSEFTFISIHPNSIINTLITNYNYPNKFACYNTIIKVLRAMGYKYHKIPKSEVINKVPETDEIFENVNYCFFINRFR